MRELLGDKYYFEFESILIDYIQELESDNHITCQLQIILQKYLSQNKGKAYHDEKVILNLNQEITNTIANTPENTITLVLYQFILNFYSENLLSLIDGIDFLSEYVNDIRLDKHLVFLATLCQFLTCKEQNDKFQYFQFLIEVTPKDVEVDGWLWYLYHDSIEREKLLKICDWFCNKTTWKRTGLFFKAYLYNETSRYTEAAISLEEVIRITPYEDDLLLWTMFYLGDVYFRLDNFTKVIRLNLKVLKFSEIAHDKELLRLFAFCNLSRVYLVKKDYENAWKFLKEALLVDDEFPLCQDLLNELKQHGFIN